ncbi:MAG TPA: hypothetical protein P5531_13760 [Bacteroidales bacterium]|nr:hypothetical protein [Bacteroidales bacterium]HSA44658.1 hypothetical protein [Bacteroidales bacterium]
MKKFLCGIFVCLCLSSVGEAQSTQKIDYPQAYAEIKSMLEGKTPVDFKRAVFVTESAYLNGSLDYQSFCADIKATGVKLKAMIRSRGLENYKTCKNWAVFSYMIDTIPVNDYQPFTYDFDDFRGDKDWSKMFITKLMKTRKGNCHSLPYFYKILCEEIGGEASLAMGPNHVYIKHRDEKGQWVNIELTNGGFPRDQWIIKELAITIEEIKNGVYMRPLTDKESISMCLFDLACGYREKSGYDNFVLQIVNTALKYYPNSLELLMTKADCYHVIGKQEKEKNEPNKKALDTYYLAYTTTVDKINSLGYQEMPKEQYDEWVRSVAAEKKKRGITSQ